MQAVASTKPAKKAKPVKAITEVGATPVKVKGPSQPPRKPRLAKNIKVPREVKVLAALSHPTDRRSERADIRVAAAEIHRNEVLAKTRGKDKKED